MIDKWLKKDIEEIFAKHKIAVVVDESKNASFLLSTLHDVKIIEVYNELDEIKAKYEIEKYKNSIDYFLIYTQIPKDKLKFLREYCETNYTLEIKFLHNYVNEKVHDYLRLNLSLSEDEIVTAAKVSVGNGEDYWRKLATKTGEIFDLESQLLPFLHSPELYIKNYDSKTAQMFFEKINTYIGQENIDKPATTLALEVVEFMFDGLAKNTIDKMLLNVYKKWLDSREYKQSFDSYLRKYELSQDIDILNVHPSHPFYQIDLKLLLEISKVLFDKSKLIYFIPKINQRIEDKQAINLNITFWNGIKTLIEFDEKTINSLFSIEECIKFYTSSFYMLDGAIRKIYTEFLDKQEILEPIQDYYKNLVVLFFDKWFQYFGEYKQNQTGTLQNIIDENILKTAIIVGDGITYEMSQNVARLVSKEYDFTNNIILTNYPSVTENNMSQIYISDGHIEKLLEKREKHIKENNKNKDIGFVYLEDVDENTNFNYLVSQYKDIDELGDKMNNKALKYFAEAEQFFAAKIEMLLKNGYKKVYMIADHGFVLTGQLKESDKIEVNFQGKKFIDERFILTDEPQNYNQDLLVQIPMAYDGYNYIYFAKSMSPFKSVGSYGFSHGGISPQELITPFLSWENNTQGNNMLTVMISNKKELSSVTGNIFRIKIEAATHKKNIFSVSRTIDILLVVQGKVIQKMGNITLNDGDIENKEFNFNGYDKLEVQLLDANTKQQLDKITVIQNKTRDLGGLL